MSNESCNCANGDSTCNEEAARRCDGIETLLRHNPSFRRIFLRILDRCSGTTVRLDELERFTEAQPGYGRLRQPPYFPIRWLSDTGALEERYLDAEGGEYSAADLADLDEDAFDELVAAFAYRSTDAGLLAASRFAPARKLSVLLANEQDRADVYLDVLRFVCEKRTFAQIETFLRGHSLFEEVSRGDTPLQPSLFVDKLESAGAVAFDKGWLITPEGKEALNTIEHNEQ